MEDKHHQEFDPRLEALQGPHVQLEPVELRHASELYEAGRDDAIWTYKQEKVSGRIMEFGGRNTYL